MSSTTQHGYLLLADISGYTSFVAATELEHSQDILSELLELIVNRLTPALTLSKLEGDAVFAYSPDPKATLNDSLLDLIESIYVAFRDRQENIHRATSCTCNACRAIPTLDLKFFAHYGDFFVQKISGREELVGSDVNLIHRLMKNHVTEATGWKGYALFTQKSLERIGLKPQELKAHAQVENYEHLGDVSTFSIDLRSRYKEIVERRRVFLDADDSDLVLIHDFAAPRSVVWEWMTDPQKRTRWMHERVWSANFRPNGRNGVGARNHCAHGKDVAIETILDWRPFDYFSVEQIVGGTKLLETVQLETLANNATRVHTHIQVAMPLPRFIRAPLVKYIITRSVHYKNEEIFAHLARLMGEDPNHGN